MNDPAPRLCELSIIVPVLNEVDQLPRFLARLRRQQGVICEILCCDGGSSDGTREWLARQPDITLLEGPAGRGRQLNQGIAAAAGEWLLLLHCDCFFADDRALRRGIDWLSRSPGQLIAGHFALNFVHVSPGSAGAYDFYQRKARLGRPETIHGDQGFLLHRRLQEKVGPLREDLPAMEDTDFAERLRAVGQWQLLPAEIYTSARRFETEGLWQRQLLGALMMCFRSIGWEDFFTCAPQVYRQQSRTGTLRLLPFFVLISQRLQRLPPAQRWRLWLRSGAYVHRHAWQLLFLIDSRRAWRQGRAPGDTPANWLFYGEPVFDLLTAHPPGRWTTALLLRLWFFAAMRRLKAAEPAIRPVTQDD
jgi:rSAM/selenodomain-associated transferase 2